MDDDVIEHRPEWTGHPDGWYAAIPPFPRWIAVDGSFGGGKLCLPTYFTRYLDRDYACAQGVDYEIESPGTPCLTPQVNIWALDRLPPDGPDRGWSWFNLATETCESTETATERIASVRRRLPALVSAPDGIAPA